MRVLGGGDAIGVHGEGPIQGWGGARARAEHTVGMQREGPTQVRLKALGARARVERTPKIQPMSVTLDVSKLSGWLNADATCRVGRRACDMRSEVWAGGGGRAWAGGSARAACTG